MKGNEKSQKDNKIIQLEPRWVVSKHILIGWAILHRNIQMKIHKLHHLRHAKIRCLDTKKTIYCRIYGPGSRGLYYDKYGEEKVKKSIFLDAYYMQKLNIENKICKQVNFIITHPPEYWGLLRSVLQHPNDGVKIGVWL